MRRPIRSSQARCLRPAAGRRSVRVAIDDGDASVRDVMFRPGAGRESGAGTARQHHLASLAESAPDSSLGRPPSSRTTRREDGALRRLDRRPTATSNALYRRLGFEAVEERTTMRFRPRV